MQKYTYMVLARPKEGREEDWLAWHRDRHSHDFLSIPGVKKCHRFEAADIPANESAKWKYMVLYEFETDDIDSIFAEVGRRFGTDSMPGTDAGDLSKGASETWIHLSTQEAPE